MQNSIKIIFVCLSLICISCLEDNIEIINPPGLDNTAQILKYFESTGDFPNSIEAPGLVSAEELYIQLSNYIALDIRSVSEFILGHIEGSISVDTKNLYSIVDSLYKTQPNRKIILISKNGQASAYFTCLLRLAGFNNVYSLNFGLASWNIDFADEWLSALGNHPNIFKFDNVDYVKNQLTKLPFLEFPDSLFTIEKKAIYRVRKIVEKGFVEDITYKKTFVYAGYYTLCYGEGLLYYSPLNSVLSGLGHPYNTKLYRNSLVFDLRSSKYLQTLPADQQIIIYSGDGQLSACIAAYLNVLGYEALTVLFGANQIFYQRLFEEQDLRHYAFSESRIRNYPYATGK